MHKRVVLVTAWIIVSFFIFMVLWHYDILIPVRLR
jgi:hypothetical protein